jgi:hypothetical protein
MPTITGAIQPPQTRPDPKQPQARPLGTQIIFFLPLPYGAPPSLTHERALGSPGVVNAPGNLVHDRQLGAPLAFVPLPGGLQLVYRGSRIAPRYAPAVSESRAVFYLHAQEVAIAGMAHDRALGTHRVIADPAPLSLVSARVLGDPTVRLLIHPAPSGLIHDRSLDSPLVAWATPTPASSTQTYWSRSLRGTRRRAPWDY